MPSKYVDWKKVDVAKLWSDIPVKTEMVTILGDTAADLLGWAAEQWWNVVNGCAEWFDLTGKGTTAIKGFWGRYYEGAASGFFTSGSGSR